MSKFKLIWWILTTPKENITISRMLFAYNRWQRPRYITISGDMPESREE